MADSCCNSFGGTIYIEANGTRLTPAEGDITITPTRSEIEGLANQDGSAAYVARPRLPRAEITFRHGCGIKWADWMATCDLNVTIVEETHGRQHLYTGTRFTGRPQINLSTGEVSGVVVEGGAYQFVGS